MRGQSHALPPVARGSRRTEWVDELLWRVTGTVGYREPGQVRIAKKRSRCSGLYRAEGEDFLRAEPENPRFEAPNTRHARIMPLPNARKVIS
jgi:hypothetical protein